ncbi:MAG: site-specific integrase [Hyphomonadaceae bacterium]
MDGSFGSSSGKRLTKFTVEAARPREQQYELSDGGSPLRLVVFPSGNKSWTVRFRVGSRTRKLTLGKYPALSLKAARTAAGIALGDIAKGSDPAAAKRETRERKSETVRACVDRYIRQWQKPRNRTAGEVESQLNRLLVNKIGGRDIREIAPRELARLVKNENRNNIGKVRHFFGWCVRQNLIDVSPAASLHCDDPIVRRERVLSDNELRAFLASLPDMGEPWASVYELIALTAQRRSEVAEAKRREFDLSAGTWTIPRDRAKNDKAHVVHLCDRALEIVKAQRGNDPDGFLFPASNDGEGAISGFSKAKTRLDRLMLAKLKEAARARGDDPERIDLPAWVIHDLRRTAATAMAARNFPIHVVERVLNHVAGSTTGGLIAVYQRHEYLAERREALEAWGTHLKALQS